VTLALEIERQTAKTKENEKDERDEGDERDRAREQQSVQPAFLYVIHTHTHTNGKREGKRGRMYM
jgi:hypothetical protein